MSYPPPPSQGPYNPYGQPGQAPQGNPGYGYPQQATGQPQYGYPQQGYAQQGYPQYPTGPGGPGGLPQKMPGQVIAARVLLFIAGGLWAIGAAIMFVGAMVAQGAMSDLDVPGIGANTAIGVILIVGVVFAAAAILHIIPAANFGKGASGTRVTAIVAGAVNVLIPLLGIIGSAADDSNMAGIFFYLLWAATAVVTIVLCAMAQASQWFNRPRT